jgi:23S rRNA pseudouridine1911/1915/1917 synthase
MSKTKKFEFNDNEQRLDVFLTSQLDGWSRGLAKTAIERGHVKVNDVLRKPSHLLKLGDIITFEEADEKESKGHLKSLIVWEDKQIIVISKPAGLLVHPLNTSWERCPSATFESEETLTSILLANRPELAESGVERVGLVHRLDRETSGIMIVAKTPEAQQSLVEQFHDRKVQKTYVGFVSGKLKDAQGKIDAPIGRNTGDKKVNVNPLGKPSVTEYKSVKRQNGFSLLELYPKTGRTNQLRIHMSWLGHPVVGDDIYGGVPAKRLMLHSKTVCFTHPKTNKKVCYTSEVPVDFTKIVNEFFKKK